MVWSYVYDTASEIEMHLGATQQATRWQKDSYTRRRAGRPRSNWIDTVTRDLKSIGMAWEDAEQAAVDREDWRLRVAQCVCDTG